MITKGTFVREGVMVRWTLPNGATGLLTHAEFEQLIGLLEDTDDAKTKAVAAKLAQLVSA